MALKRAMRSWMSIAAATAARDELEFGQQGIARIVDQRAAGDGDGRPPNLGLRRFEVPDREVLVALHHADETGDVGMKDRGKTALRGRHYETAVNIRLVEMLSSR